MWHWNEMGSWWWVMALGMTVFWLTIAWVVVTLVRSRAATPNEELARRFARGEIDEAEFERKRAVLR